MIQNYFWELVEESIKYSKGDRKLQLEFIQNRLEEETSDTIRRYCIYLTKLLKDACKEEIWAAFYTMNGGFEEWGFEDFRYWLIAHGKDFWENTLKDPINFLYDKVNFEEGENPEVTFYEFWSLFKTTYERKSDSALSNNMEWIKSYEEVQLCELALEKVMRPKANNHIIRKEYPKMHDKFFQNYYYLLKLYHEKK